jgi:serine/threonine protein kinase
MMEVSLFGSKYTLSSNDLVKIGSGGEGDVYRVNLVGKPYALKIYKFPSEEKHQKIDAMLKNSPSDASASINSMSFIQLAWPIGKCFNGSKFVGFLMPYVDYGFSNTLDYYLDPSLYREKFKYESFALSYKVEVARNLAGVLKLLHSKGHHFIDFKPQNIRIYDRYHLVSLIDCDGFDICGIDGSRYPAKSFSSEYINPRALKLNSPPESLGEDQDLFVLAIVIFQILNFGIHPYSGILKDGSSLATTDEKVREGYYPYGITPNNRISPNKFSVHSMFLPELRSLFDRAFSGSINNYPKVDEWIKVLEEVLAEKKLTKCPTHPSKAEHIHFQSMGCMACFREGVLSKFTTTKSKSSAYTYSYQQSPTRGQPFSTNKNIPNYSGGSNKPKSYVNIVMGVVGGLLLVGFFVAISDSNKTTPFSGTKTQTISTTSSKNSLIEPFLGEWSSGACNQNKVIFTASSSSQFFGYREFWLPDNKGNVTMITEVKYVSPNRFTLTFSGRDGAFLGEQEIEKVGQKIKIWRSIRLKPEEKAFILNGKTIDTGDDVALLERCQ